MMDDEKITNKREGKARMRTQVPLSLFQSVVILCGGKALECLLLAPLLLPGDLFLNFHPFKSKIY